MLKRLKDQALTKLQRFAASQENIDWVATRLGMAVVALGVVVAIATIAAMIAK